jgi:hypothetical protein
MGRTCDWDGTLIQAQQTGGGDCRYVIAVNLAEPGVSNVVTAHAFLDGLLAAVAQQVFGP